MKKLMEKLEWIFDYYIVYFLYNPQKIHRYVLFMKDKWELLPEQPYRIKKTKCKVMDGSTITIFSEFDSAEQPGNKQPYYF